jgi:hypothetical protein
MSTYYKKYLKYKNKYLELKSQIGGEPNEQRGEQAETKIFNAPQAISGQKNIQPVFQRPPDRTLTASPSMSQAPPQSPSASQSQAPPRPPSMSQAPPQPPSASQSQAPPRPPSASQSQASPQPPSMSQASPQPSAPQSPSNVTPVVKNNCNKFKVGSYVKQISIDSRYMKYSIDNTPKNPGESDAQHLARVKDNQKLFLEEFELGIITEILKCGLQWKENYYKVKLPNYDIPIHLYENEIIPITEKEYNTILSAKRSRVKAFNHELTEKLLKQRLTVLMEL